MSRKRKRGRRRTVRKRLPESTAGRKRLKPAMSRGVLAFIGAIGLSIPGFLFVHEVYEHWGEVAVGNWKGINPVWSVAGVAFAATFGRALVGSVLRMIGTPKVYVFLFGQALHVASEDVLEWRLVGRADRVRRLRFSLQAFEQREHWSDASSETDGQSRRRTSKKFVSETPLATVEDLGGADHGEVAVRVPPGIDPRLRALKYELRVRAKVRGWIGIDETFEVFVATPR